MIRHTGDPKRHFQAIGILVVLLILFGVGLFNDTFLIKAKDPLDTKKAPLKTAQHNVIFEESSKALGIVADHPALNNEGVMEYPFRASAAVSTNDLNNDGLIDIVTTNWTGSSGFHIFYQNKNGDFQETTSHLVSDYDSLDNLKEHVSGVVSLDLDNDGFLDLVVVRTGCISIYKNSDGKKFNNVTSQWLTAPICAGFSGANFADFNGDGYLDLYLQSTSSNYTNPAGSGFNGLDGIRNVLLINRDGKELQDRTEEFGIQNGSISWGSLLYYSLKDHNLILTTINDFYNNRIYYKFRGADRFVERPVLPRDLVMGHMGGDVVYLKNQTRSSLYITNATRVGYNVGFNLMLEWDLKSNRFKNTASHLDVNNCGFGWGAKFGDFDNDSLGDIFSANGYWNFGPKPYWFPYMTYGSGPLYLRGEVQTANSIPKTKGTQLAGSQMNCLFMQNSETSFQDEAAISGLTDLLPSRGVALADINNDGRLDIVVANINHPPSVYLNKTQNSNTWIGFKIESKKRNRSGIGASIYIKVAGGIIRRDLFPANGFGGSNENRIHIGLGNYKVEKVEVVWPDGEKNEVRKWHIGQYNTIND